jgi:hypothetical protein
VPFFAPGAVVTTTIHVGLVAVAHAVRAGRRQARVVLADATGALPSHRAIARGLVIAHAGVPHYDLTRPAHRGLGHALIAAWLGALAAVGHALGAHRVSARRAGDRRLHR